MIFSFTRCPIHESEATSLQLFGLYWSLSSFLPGLTHFELDGFRPTHVIFPFSDTQRNSRQRMPVGSLHFLALPASPRFRLHS